MHGDSGMAGIRLRILLAEDEPARGRPGIHALYLSSDSREAPETTPPRALPAERT